MLSDIPAELLLDILSYLDNLEPISGASRSLSLATRDCRTRALRARLASIRHIELLMRTWSPPTFFTRRGGAAYTSGGYFTRPDDLHDILCDPDMFRHVETYLDSLERKAYAAERVADYLLSIVQFSARTNAERQSYATRIVIELWSAQARYSHDVDGRWLNISDGFDLQDVHIQDSYVMSLPGHIQSAMVTAYDALAQNLRPPFYSPSRRSHGWLYRLIVKVGFLAVLTHGLCFHLANTAHSKPRMAWKVSLE